MSRDRQFDLIESACDAPMIDVNWAAQTDDEWHEATRVGLVDWFRKMPDVVRRRRSSHPVGSEMSNACDKVLFFAKYYAGDRADPRFFEMRETWTHNILGDFAEWQRRKTGRECDALAQAVLRDALHELERTERRGL